jgi:hypothetical protein
MTKTTTKGIIQTLANIGTDLNFDVKYEYRIPIGGYQPHYDLVWFLDLTKLIDIKILEKFLGKTEILQYFQQFPLAVFEIEGSTTTSKNQVGNFANTIISPFYFKFLITDNEGAAHENDTYRRGVKILRTYSTLIGNRNTFLFDKSHIQKVIVNEKLSDAVQIVKREITKKGSGGESTSTPYISKIVKHLSRLNLECIRDYKPEVYSYNYSIIEELNNIKGDKRSDFILGKVHVHDPQTNEIKANTKKEDYFYIPKIDLCYGFNLPEKFVNFFMQLSTILGSEVVNYPLLNYLKSKKDATSVFLPLIGIEVETTNSKHLNGGILNLSTHTFCGILASEKDTESHLTTYKHVLGIQNVLFKDISTL